MPGWIMIHQFNLTLWNTGQKLGAAFQSMSAWKQPESQNNLKKTALPANLNDALPEPDWKPSDKWNESFSKNTGKLPAKSATCYFFTSNLWLIHSAWSLAVCQCHHDANHRDWQACELCDTSDRFIGPVTDPSGQSNRFICCGDSVSLSLSRAVQILMMAHWTLKRRRLGCKLVGAQSPIFMDVEDSEAQWDEKTLSQLFVSPHSGWQEPPCFFPTARRP
jgi:hypothetical protein